MTKRPPASRSRKSRKQSSPPVPEAAGKKTVRLARLLAQAGLGSRRQCEEYILAGRVSVDGRVTDCLSTQVDPQRQKVCLDGQPLKTEPKRYYLVNKPAGYVCTNRDPAGRPRAVDLVPQDGPRLFTVGRLDAGSRGLLLITNDGDLAHRLAHPRFQVERRYEVQVAGRPTQQTLEQLKRGLHFSEGRFRLSGYRRRRTQKNSTFLDVILTEGRNREIRRLFARAGHKVLKLRRIGFGPLKLGRLKEGQFRPLSTAERRALQELVAQGQTAAGKPPKKKRAAAGKKTLSAGLPSPRKKSRSTTKSPATKSPAARQPRKTKKGAGTTSRTANRTASKRTATANRTASAKRPGKQTAKR